jgi:hypothetical protein
MKQRTFSLVVLFLLLISPAGAQDSGISMPTLQIRALGIDNETRQINSLLGVQGKFFKRAFELQAKGSLSPDEKTQLSTEAVQRKADITTLKNQFQSLINKLKQKNNWNEALDAQFVAALKESGDRSLLTQAGGARKLLEAGAADFDGLRDFLEQEVVQVSKRQAHASAPLGNFGCSALLASYILATASGSENSISCAVAMVYNRKGCKPGITSGAACR